ncbi:MULTISPECIES: VanZ family protein [unclassified Janibacter]|uniref:VanZ family protein n=1 Tax=unclassified Janibacter TaxID=2649294 RepID=UPI003CFC27AD
MSTALDGQPAKVARGARPWAAAFVVLLAVHLLSLYWPRVAVSGPVSWSDKVMHVLLFAAPVLAGLRARLPLVPLVAVFALHAPVSELVQHVALRGRSGDVSDALADLAGVGLGLALALLIRGPRRVS